MTVLKLPAMRVPPSRDEISDVQAGFAGGANPLGASGMVPVDQVAAMTNMRLVRNQELAKRPGLRRLAIGGGAGGLSAGMRLFPSAFSTGRVLALDTAGNAQYFTQAGTTAPVTDLTDLAQAVNPGFYSTPFRDGTGDVLYVGAYRLSPNKGMLKWDGLTTITEDVAGAFIRGLGVLWVYNQRMFGVLGLPVGATAASTPTFASRSQTLYWSGLNNGDTIGDTANGGGSATIRTYGGRSLVGGFALGASNYLLHENSISVFRGTTFDDINITAGIQGVSPNVGFPMAWAAIDQVGYVLTTEGLFLVTEGGGVRPAGTPQYPDPIKQYLLSITGRTGYAHDSAPASWFILDNPRRDEVWLLVSTTNASVDSTRLFIWHTTLQRFTGQGTFAVVVTSACSAFDDVGLPTMLFADASGNSYATDFVDDASQLYTEGGGYISSVRLRRMYSQEAPTDQKAFRYAYITMGAGAGITPATVGSSTSATLGYTNSTGTVADTTNLKAQAVNAIQLSGQGPSIDLTITDAGGGTGWSVVRAEIEGASYGKRGG